MPRPRIGAAIRSTGCAAPPISSPICSAVEARRHGAAADALLRDGGGRALSALLPPHVPFPERRLSERGLGRALRLSGRGAVRRRRRADAPAGAGAAARGVARHPGGAAARRGCSISAAAPAPSCARSSATTRASRSPGSTCRSPISRWPARRLADWSRVTLIRGRGGGDAVRRRRIRSRQLHLPVP